VAFRTFRSDSRNAAADLVSRVLCPVYDLSVRLPSTVCRKNGPVGDSSACWSIALLSYLPARSHCVPQRSSRAGAGCICVASVTWIVRAAKTHTNHEPGTQRATGALRRRCAVFHHTDFPDPIRSTMDHSGLGAGRRSAVLALSSGATSRATFGGYWFARRRIHSPGAQSSRTQLSSARRVPDFQLVSLHIRDRDGLPVRRCAITGGAAQSRARAQCAAVTLYAWHRARLLHREHRDR